MPEKGKNILKWHPRKKSLKSLFTIYSDLECFANKGAILSKQS